MMNWKDISLASTLIRGQRDVHLREVPEGHNCLVYNIHFLV